jgi:pimeloyl-ACP methyl ester carboxylesterase
MEELSAGGLTAARAGRGRDLVIVHSLLVDRHGFDAVVPALATRFRVTVPDLPGFHGTKPVEGSIDDYAAWLRDAFDVFGIGRDAILMGNGFGGTIALAFALANGQRIAKLVLADVAATFPDAGKQAFRTMAAKAEAGAIGDLAEFSVNRVFHAAYLAKHPEAIGERRAVLLKIDPTGFRAGCKVLAEVDLVPELGKLSVPTLVVYGALDQSTLPPLNQLIAARVPGALLIELPGCGHCPPLEQPETFLAAIDDFIDKP